MRCHYFAKIGRSMKGYLRWLAAGLMGLAVGLVFCTTMALADATTSNSPLNVGPPDIVKGLQEQREKILNQEAATNSTPANVDRVNSDGYLDFKWGTCPLSLENGTLTIHAGMMENFFAGTSSDVYKLFQSNLVSKIIIEDGVSFPADGLSVLIFSIAKNVKTIYVSKGVIFPENCNGLFAGILDVSSIIFENGIDTSNVMEMESMFSLDPNLESLNLVDFNTKNVNKMTGMFQQILSSSGGGSRLAKITFGLKFVTSNVTDMAGMFGGNDELKSLDLSNFDTRKAANLTDIGKGTDAMLGITANLANIPVDSLLHGLWKIKIGPNTIIKNVWPQEEVSAIGLPAAPSNPQFTDLDFPGATFDNNGPNWQEVGTSTDGHNPTGPLLSGADLNKHFEQPRQNTETWVWQQAPAAKQTVTLNYVDQNGKKIADPRTISGYLGTSYDVSGNDYQLTIPGYSFSKTTGDLKGTYGDRPIAVTFEYTGSSSGSGGSSAGQQLPPASPTTPQTPTGPSTPASPGTTTPTPTPKPVVPTPGGQNAVVKGVAVYAIKKIGMYRGGNFTGKNRLVWYPKQKRVNRPMFVVTGYKRAANGALRYKVRDVNHGRKTAGKTGYITASRKYVVPVYYASVPKSQRVTVISRKGVNAYKSPNLTGKTKHYKKGVRLTVKKLVKHNLTTRYQLNNGRFITANKKLIIAGNY
ncbi:MAG: DUF5776 domain-containing protein [Lentilactobacillus diolivorans]|uniref:DUF5776 domain-containing protein n=1 Tax=Lentilactobacillus diolivorans TaxID=179838 RepID=UPI0039EBDD36